MRRLVLALAAFALVVGPGGAADLPIKAPQVAPVVAPVPVWSWSGCYVGVNGGGTRAQNRADLSPGGLYLAPPGATPPPNAAGTGDFAADIAALSHSYEMANNGWEAGGQVGCNAQWGMAVVGVEGDWQWTNTSTAADAAFAAFPNVGSPLFTNAAHTEHVDVTQRWFATGRVRAGFTPWERVLIYGTGGVAWANYTSNTAVIFANVPNPFAGVFQRRDPHRLGFDQPARLGRRRRRRMGADQQLVDQGRVSLPALQRFFLCVTARRCDFPVRAGLRLEHECHAARACRAHRRELQIRLGPGLRKVLIESITQQMLPQTFILGRAPVFGKDHNPTIAAQPVPAWI